MYTTKRDKRQAVVGIKFVVAAQQVAASEVAIESNGTGSSRLDRRPFLEDWATLFKLLEEGEIKPVIMNKFPILEAAQANALLENGQVVGNIVLAAPKSW